MTDNIIYINIWDDYFDDEFIPEGKIQETYAYVECDAKEEVCKNILELLKETIEALVKPESPLELSLEYYDSAKVYPSLVGTEHENILYKRWQLEMKHLTHEVREYLVEKLQDKKLKYLDMPIKIYSES